MMVGRPPCTAAYAKRAVSCDDLQSVDLRPALFLPRVAMAELSRVGAIFALKFIDRAHIAAHQL